MFHDTKTQSICSIISAEHTVLTINCKLFRKHSHSSVVLRNTGSNTFLRYRKTPEMMIDCMNGIQKAALMTGLVLRPFAQYPVIAGIIASNNSGVNTDRYHGLTHPLNIMLGGTQSDNLASGYSSSIHWVILKIFFQQSFTMGCD